MYTEIKNILIKIIPKKILFKYENSLRFYYYLIYKGTRYQCNICGKGLRKFISSNNDKICPRCGSLSRARRLWDLLDSEYLSSDLSILDFSPSRSLYRRIKQNRYNYISSDLSENFISNVSYDITNISVSDNTFNLIICYHILEHIEDDNKAMRELYRVVMKKGYCIIQTPFKEGEIYEDPSNSTANERALNFGQEDHFRIYSASGLRERLVNTGFTVEMREFNEKENNIQGFKNSEIILICQK